VNLFLLVICEQTNTFLKSLYAKFTLFNHEQKLIRQSEKLYYDVMRKRASNLKSYLPAVIVTHNYRIRAVA